MPATAAHRFTLEKYRTSASRHTCPECGKRREFTRYVDTSGEVEFPAYVGKCNREMNCGYHYTPRQYFKDAGICFDRQGNTQTSSADAPRRAVSRPQPTAAPMPTASHIDPAIFRRSLAGSNSRDVGGEFGLLERALQHVTEPCQCPDQGNAQQRQVHAEGAEPGEEVA